MIDYDKTMEKFFVDVEAYLTKRMESAKDTIEAKIIQKTRFQWGLIKANPKKYVNQKYDDLHSFSPEGFMRGRDSSVYLAISNVLNAIRKIYADRQAGLTYQQEMHIEEFLDAYKRWKYKSSTSMFKDFTFPFRSAESFAVHVSSKTNKTK